MNPAYVYAKISDISFWNRLKVYNCRQNLAFYRSSVTDVALNVRLTQHSHPDELEQSMVIHIRMLSSEEPTNYNSLRTVVKRRCILNMLCPMLKCEGKITFMLHECDYSYSASKSHTLPGCLGLSYICDEGKRPYSGSYLTEPKIVPYSPPELLRKNIYANSAGVSQVQLRILFHY
ncbi:hypothetical protein BDY19DRAFT_401620 [Irpex rosettiformis]|uniref:Uncharacterized protein n=1 Tax=Irpex rosettiformis TaxID=378272 RepID=A0ACB8UF73_9APHY|nr:hypothetical protein BDY19DRAFT_401620 [Irpex rosettiformis]